MKKSILNVINKCYEIYQTSGYAAVIDYINLMQSQSKPIYIDIVYEHCTECDNDMPSINHICLICGQITTIVQDEPACNVQVPEFIQNMDWKLLRTQKEAILTIINWNKLPLLNESLEGIISLLDAVQDYAVDVAGYSETDVFLFDTDDQNQEKIIGYQIIHDDTNDLHPDMEGSFCIYSKEQCEEILSKERNKSFRLLPIHEGDIEEPTFMFHPESIWSEIHFDYVDNDIMHVDAWINKDVDEEGKTIAKIHPNKNVEYLDERAKTDAYAQEIIKALLNH